MFKKLLVSLLVSASSLAFAAPLPITDADQCHSCDMWITKHPGPKGEIVMHGGKTYKFCSVKCLSCTLLRLGQNDDMQAVYVHDAAANDWEKPEMNFIELKDAWLVVGSSKKATMGKSVAPFKTKEAAEKFQAEFGGEIVRFNELTKELLGCKVPKKPSQPLVK